MVHWRFLFLDAFLILWSNTRPLVNIKKMKALGMA